MIRISSYINKGLLFSVLITLAIVSCNSESGKDRFNKAPIKEDKFVEIMVDVRLAESVIRKQSSIGNDPKTITKQLYDSIFEKYNITKSDFETSLKMYSSNPDEMYTINERVVEALSKLEAEVKAQKHIKSSDDSKK
jgi:hypothetical protein